MLKQSARIISLLVVISPGFFISSCTSEHLTPVCDTLKMSYSQNVVPILKYNCYTCHSVGNSVGSVGILLDNYDSLKKYANQGGYLVGNITHEPGFVAMPYMKPKLDACSINQIVAWVNQGAPDN